MKFIIKGKPAQAPSTIEGPRRKTPLERAAVKASAEREDPVEKAAKVVETAVDRLAKINPELAEKKRFLRDETAKQETTMRDMHDTGHWFCVNAESRAQKEGLLKALGLFETHDKYLSALDVAALLASLLEAPEEERAAAVAALDALLAEPAPRFATPKQSKRLLALTRR